MSDQKNGPLKRVNDALDLASIPVQGESERRAAGQRALRFVLGTSPLFPKNGYSDEDVEIAVGVTTNFEVAKARILRPSGVLAVLLVIGTLAPGVVDIVRSEYRKPPTVEQNDRPTPMPTPGAPVVAPGETGYNDSLIWKTDYSS